MKEMLKKIWNKGLPHIFAGSFLTKCISFFGSIVLVRALSKSDYGVLSYLSGKEYTAKRPELFEKILRKEGIL